MPDREELQGSTDAARQRQDDELMAELRELAGVADPVPPSLLWRLRARLLGRATRAVADPWEVDEAQ